jgi:uncharacterized repeat protein (TIGR04052 family)
MRHIKIPSSVWKILIIMIFGIELCNLIQSSTAVAETKQLPITIHFSLSNDIQKIGCGSVISGIGVNHIDARLREARFYVYDIKLIDQNGERTRVSLTQNDWQYADLALIDFRDARGGNAPCSATNAPKNSALNGLAATGDYAGLEFSVGVPVQSEINGKTISLNHSNVDTAPPPLDVQAMSWNWQAGRRFFSIELDPTNPVVKSDGSKAKTWMVHLGSIGCKGNPATGEIVSCSQPNRFSVVLDKFNAKTDRVNLDLAVLLKNSDLSKDRGGAIGCMSALDDPECGPLFKALGLNAPGETGAGMQSKTGQSSVFSARPIPIDSENK